MDKEKHVVEELSKFHPLFFAFKPKEPKKKNPCRECGEEMDGEYFFQERQHKTCQKCNAKYGRNARKPKEEKS